jgi:segregation and condensation protein B
MVLENSQIIEALLFASDGPVSAKKIKEIMQDIHIPEVKKLIEGINNRYEDNKSPLQIIEIAEGYQIVTRQEYANWIAKLVQAKNTQRLTKKALETLAIVAYKQPITKLEIEAIRGVNSDAVVRTLIERNLITVVGREKAPGNPLLYGTTKFFMEYFGLEDLSHLPRLKEIDELLKNDEQFLESIDQVALEQLHPEALGISGGQSDASGESETEDEGTERNTSSPEGHEPENSAQETDKNDASQ